MDLRDGPIAKGLVLPLRDAVRGAQGLASVPKSFLPKPSEVLPEPIGDLVGNVLQRAREMREQSPFHKSLDPADVRRARAGLFGEGPASDAVGPFAMALSFAIGHGLLLQKVRRVLVSETVLALTVADPLRRAGDGIEPADLAAQLIGSLRQAPIVNDMLASGVAGADETSPSPLDLALVAAFVWFLADRSGEDEEETHLLDLACALTVESRADVAAALRQEQDLGCVLRDLAALI